MWVIEKIKREDENAEWEPVMEFPTYGFQDEASVGHAFVIEFNCDRLDSKYYYRIAWN